MMKSYFLSSFLCVFLLITLEKCISIDHQRELLRRPEAITKIELRIEADSQYRNVVITDSAQLRRIDEALKTMSPSRKMRSTDVITSAYVTVFKGGQVVHFFIDQSRFFGWLVKLDDDAYESEYLADLIARNKINNH